MDTKEIQKRLDALMTAMVAKGLKTPDAAEPRIDPVRQYGTYSTIGGRVYG